MSTTANHSKFGRWITRIGAVAVTLCAGLILGGCATQSINCGVPCDYETGLVFATGFEGTILGSEENSWIYPTGSDPGEPIYGSWDEFAERPSIGTIKINFGDGDPTQRSAAIVPDPDPAALPGNEVFRFQILEPHQSEPTLMKGRVQLDVNENQCITEVHQTVRLFLDPELDFLRQWDEQFGWFSLFEFWNNADWTNERYPFRVTVNLRKDATGPVDHLYFNVKGDMKNNCFYCRWHDVWDHTGTGFPVPIGSWMEIEVYIREGDDSDGRFLMAVTPEGGARQVVFDVTETTQHPDETCPDGFTHMQPLKLYTSDRLINYMRDSGRAVTVYWDDWDYSINSGP